MSATGTIDLPAIAPSLRAHARWDDKAVVVRFEGAAELQTTAPLDAVVKRIHEEARSGSAAEVVIDFRELEFMNSSSFKAFVSWIMLMQEGAPESRYRMRFLSDDTKLWQRRSLHALSCFAADHIVVDK